LHHMLQTTCKHVSVVLLLCTFSLDWQFKIHSSVSVICLKHI
jgi:hypothetical protein